MSHETINDKANTYHMLETLLKLLAGSELWLIAE